MSEKKTVLSLLLAAIIVLTGAVAVGIVRKQPAWPSKELMQAQKTTDFAIYYPAPLPEGFHYSQGSVHTANGVVIYSLASGASKITVTVQRRPAGVDFNDFYTRLLTNKSDALNTHGKAVVGTAGGKLIGSLVTDKEWTILSTSVGTDPQLLSRLTSSLTPLKR